MRSVKSLAQVEQMDDLDLVDGYRSGLAAEDEPGDNRSDSFWHGWRNGASDRGLREIDDDQRNIAREFVARSNGKTEAV